MYKFFYIIFSFLPIILFSQENILSYEICDENDNGLVEVDLNYIKEWGIDKTFSNVNSPEIYLTRVYGGVTKIVDVFSNTRREVPVCINDSFSNRFYDIAINSKKEIFVTLNGNQLYKLDPNTCTYTFIIDIGKSLPDIDPYFSNTNIALSFDNQDNLYVGVQSRKVFRADADDLTTFYLWKEFDLGAPAGDFVMIEDYMFIAWHEAFGDTYLLKVTLDNDNQYLSHEEVGRGYPSIYGLAAEYGKLFAANPNFLFEINLENFSYERVINKSNNGYDSSDEWWGAAGLHEAINYKITIHETKEDAEKNQNAILTNTYHTTQPYKQFIYIRISDDKTNYLEILPVEINVIKKPIVNNLKKEYCILSDNLPFSIDLSDFNFEINNDDNSPNFSFFKTEVDAKNNTNPINPSQTLNKSEIYYVRTTNAKQCFSISKIELSLVVNQSYDFLKEYEICEGEIVSLSVPNKYKSIEWLNINPVDQNQDVNSLTINITIPGEYKVKLVYDSGCEFTEIINVKYAPNHSIVQIVAVGNKLKVLVNPLEGEYEYSLDAIYWQKSNEFNGLENQTYTIWVRRIDAKSCFTGAISYKLFSIPNVITPNQDGYNDYWDISNIRKDYPNAFLQIFDREGRTIIKGLTKDILPWNGKSPSGNKIPTSSVWYIIKLSDVEIYQGSILIKNK